MYVLWVLGTIGKALTPIVGQDATVGLVKIPGILADVGVAWLLFVICRRWGGELIERSRIGVSPEGLGLLAAGVYLFNPGTVFVSSVWGQIDSVGTLVLLATIYALARGWIEVAALGAVVALLVKFQFAFLVPIVAIVGLRRHLFGRSSDPELDGHRDPLRVLTALAVGIGALTLLMLPFGMVVYAPLAGGDPHGVLGILPAADPNTEPGRQALRGRQHLPGPHHQCVQPVAESVERAGRHLPARRRRRHGADHRIVRAQLAAGRGAALRRRGVAGHGAGRAPGRPARDPACVAAAGRGLLRPADSRPRALPVPGAGARGAAPPLGPRVALDLRRPEPFRVRQRLLGLQRGLVVDREGHQPRCLRTAHAPGSVPDGNAPY